MANANFASDPAIVNLNSSARVLLTTVTHKLLPSLSNANAAVTNGTEEAINWADALNHYATSAKQIDHLWQGIAGSGPSTESGFDLTIVTPIDSGHPSAEQIQHQQRQQQGVKGKQEAVYVGVSVPPLLSTSIPAEDARTLPSADAQYALPSAAAEEELLAQIRAHNQALAEVTEGVGARLEQWRAEKEQQRAARHGQRPGASAAGGLE